ncbi:thiamine phosphate synthase [Ruminococcus sp. OA3]|uniref:thiamine phosphate synthase n=1 Tax=Ruminococcus sp. OA3 TaxID=2914164 RepID=UPI001F05441D|nr:thiamine phosphate synthase [Ruminococcus sp. OA3]MCH1981866.1 thiamine phosphate synthase [Ruminococcus sp. OA3]
MIMCTFKIIAVTNRRLCHRPLTEQLERIASVIRPDLVMLREKDLSEEAYQDLAEKVTACCMRLGIPCVLHTYAKVARRLAWPAIHLPFTLFQEQWMEVKEFNACGTSVHSVEDAVWAQEHNAAYVTAGHIFPTGCKPGLPPRGLDFLEKVCSAVDIPVYAIGGITEKNLNLVRETRASGACMMSNLMKI